MLNAKASPLEVLILTMPAELFVARVKAAASSASSERLRRDYERHLKRIVGLTDRRRGGRDFLSRARWAPMDAHSHTLIDADEFDGQNPAVTKE